MIKKKITSQVTVEIPKSILNKLYETGTCTDFKGKSIYQISKYLLEKRLYGFKNSKDASKDISMMVGGIENVSDVYRFNITISPNMDMVLSEIKAVTYLKKKNLIETIIIQELNQISGGRE